MSEALLLGSPPDLSVVERVRLERSGVTAANTPATTRYIIATGGSPQTIGTATAARSIFALPSGDIAVPGRKVLYRLRVDVFPNDTAPSSDFSWFIRPVTATSGAAGINAIKTLGTIITASEAKLASASIVAGTPNSCESEPFEAASSYYALGVTTGSTVNASGDVAFLVTLWQKWVAA